MAQNLTWKPPMKARGEPAKIDPVALDTEATVEVAVSVTLFAEAT